MIKLIVNDRPVETESNPETPLLWILRDELGLTGAKYSCGIGECGACTVLLNGDLVQSCSTTLKEAAGGRVTTIEGLTGPTVERVKTAWEEEDVPQCGFCQPAQIITAAELLSRNPRPGDDEITEAMDGVLCRCGAYPAIKRAVRSASGRKVD